MIKNDIALPEESREGRRLTLDDVKRSCDGAKPQGGGRCGYYVILQLI